MGTFVWKERAGRDLAIELSGPATGDLAGTTGASAFGSQTVVFDEISEPADQSLAASRAACVFPMSDLAWKIAGIDVTQPRCLTNFGSLEQVFGSGVSLAVSLHFVVGVKGSDVPRDVGRYPGDEIREAAKFIWGVIEAGDQQRNDLEPQSHLVNPADAVEDGTDSPAELMVVAIVEALEIHFVEIEPGPNVFEDLRCAVAVGNESGQQAGAFRLLKDCYGPFAGDQRLIVGADQNLRALVEGIANQGFGRYVQRRRHRVRITQRLRRNPVLTVSTVEIAAQHAEAVGESAGVRVEERLLFDGIALRPGGISPRNVECAAAVVADFAHAGLAFGDRAAVTARETSDAVVVEFFVERGVGLANSLVQDVAEGGHRHLYEYSSAEKRDIP